jgi:hypothetical protein
MSAIDVQNLLVGLLEGATSSSVFVLALFIGVCVLFGFTKLKQTSGDRSVVKSLDEVVSHRPVLYLAPDAPHGPADQLRSPELLEAAARK